MSVERLVVVRTHRRWRCPCGRSLLAQPTHSGAGHWAWCGWGCGRRPVAERSGSPFAQRWHAPDGPVGPSRAPCNRARRIALRKCSRGRAAPAPKRSATSNMRIAKRAALDWRLAATSGMESGAIGVVPARMEHYRKVWIPDGAPSRIDYHSGGLKSGSRA